MFEDDEQTHPCEMGGCKNVVGFDDEPYCFDHSPDSGSVLVGYSYKRNHPVDA